MAEISSKADLLAAGYGGYAGWGETEALADFRATGGAGKYDPGVSGGATTGGGVADYTSIARQMLQMQQEANVPAIQSLEAGLPEISTKYATQRGQLEAEKEPLTARYERLLKDITSRTELASAREFGRRGIPLSSGLYETTLAERIEPQRERIGLEKETGLRELTNLITGLTGRETEEMRTVRNAIAQLKAGGASSAITNALSLYQTQLQAKQAAEQRASQERISQAELAAKPLGTEVVTVGGRKKLINTQTGEVISDLGPSTEGGGAGVDLSAFTGLFGGGITTPTEPKPTSKPSSTTTPSTRGGFSPYSYYG